MVINYFTFINGGRDDTDTPNDPHPTIRGDKLVLAMVSIPRTLIVELDKAGVMPILTMLAAIDDTVATHRELGDPNWLTRLKRLPPIFEGP
jgi:hypothetical protein